MKILFFVIFLALASNFCFSQNKMIDSLKHELAIAKHDTSRILIMSGICNALGGSSPDSALYYCEKALALARKIKFPKGEIRALSFNSGLVLNVGNLPKALSMAFEALQIAEKNKLSTEKKWPFVYISAVYRTLNDFPRALSFRKKALEIAESSADTSSMIIENSNIGTLFIEFGQLDSASYFLNRSMVLANGSERASTIKGLGDIQSQKGDYVRAMDYYQKGLQLSKSANNFRNISSVYLSIANLYKNKSQRDSSIYYAEKALSISQPILFERNTLEASTLLSELYETINNKESYRYYKLATATKESLFGAGNIQALQEMIAQEEERQKEVERAKAALQNQLKQYALITGLVVFLLIAFIFYRNNKKQKEANTLLQEQKQKVESTLTQLKSTQAQLIQSEKLASLGELTAGIAHEIQNPLNFVNNFSELSVGLAQEINEEIDKNAFDKEYVKELMGDLTQNQEKINHHGKRAASIVTGMLQHSQASPGKKELTDINQLANEYLSLAYHGLRAKDNTFNSDFKTDFDENLPKIEVITQDIGRVLLNLINNAFWAVKTVENPLVTVKTEHTVNQIIIKVIDNGTGMAEDVKVKIFQPFFTTKPTGQGTGLGLSLAYDIVTKGHGGTIEVESVESEGTTLIVKLPLKTI